MDTMVRSSTTGSMSQNDMSHPKVGNQQLTSREFIINTAIKFLQNPRVETTSLEHKQSFLRQKGLTEEEIDIACKKSGAYSHEQVDKSLLPVVPRRPKEFVQYTHHLPVWAKARDIANLVALLSIGSYSLYTIWSRYIAPKLFGKPSRQTEKFQKLLDSVTNLNENISELKEQMNKFQTQQANQLSQVLRSNLGSSKNSNTKESIEIQELHQELASIKALLLSRTQFPSSPGIPSWQMLDKETGHEDEDRDTSPGPQDSKTDDKVEEIDPIPLPVTRKHSSSGSRDSIGLHSDSSCEVVMIGGKNDSSDLDHSDD